MKTILNLIVLVFQAVVTLITLTVIYMIFVLMDYQGGIDNFIGTALFQPIIGALIAIVTIAICILIGLPIRLNDSINRWWTRRIWLSIFGILAGLLLLTLSLMSFITETVTTPIENDLIQKQIPNLALATTGWFMTCFSLLHLFPPYSVSVRIEKFFERIIGRSKNFQSHDV